MTTISGAEATDEYYYEDGFRINVNMKSELNWWSFVTHLVVTIVAVVFSYYVFAVKAKQDRVVGQSSETQGDSGLWSTPFRPVRAEGDPRCNLQDS
eukprot:1632118-Pyramimonas_sp.AAC.1